MVLASFGESPLDYEALVSLTSIPGDFIKIKALSSFDYGLTEHGIIAIYKLLTKGHQQ